MSEGPADPLSPVERLFSGPVGEFKTHLAALLKRLQAPTEPNSPACLADIEEFGSYIAFLRAGGLSGISPATSGPIATFIKDFLPGGVQALLSFPCSKLDDFSVVYSCLSSCFSLVALHFRLALPVGAPATLPALPENLQQPPTPPAFQSTPLITIKPPPLPGQENTAAAAVVPVPLENTANNEEAPAAAVEAPIPSQFYASLLLPDPLPHSVSVTPSFLEIIRSATPAASASPNFPALRDFDAPMAEILDALLDDTKSLYQKFGHAPSDSVAPVEPEAEQAALQAWRAQLAVGGSADFFHNGKWECVEITEERSGEEFVVSGESFNENVPKLSSRLAPLFSRSCPNLEAWRRELAENSVCDALDTVHKWYTAKVVEARGGHVKISYDGWCLKAGTPVKTQGADGRWRDAPIEEVQVGEFLMGPQGEAVPIVARNPPRGCGVPDFLYTVELEGAEFSVTARHELLFEWRVEPAIVRRPETGDLALVYYDSSLQQRLLTGDSEFSLWSEFSRLSPWESSNQRGDFLTFGAQLKISASSFEQRTAHLSRKFLQDALVAVKVHAQQQKQRKFNPSEEFAAPFADFSGASELVYSTASKSWSSANSAVSSPSLFVLCSRPFFDFSFLLEVSRVLSNFSSSDFSSIGVFCLPRTTAQFSTILSRQPRCLLTLGFAAEESLSAIAAPLESKLPWNLPVRQIPGGARVISLPALEAPGAADKLIFALENSTGFDRGFSSSAASFSPRNAIVRVLSISLDSSPSPWVGVSLQGSHIFTLSNGFLTGNSSRYDEWLPRSSDRLALHKSRANGGSDSGGVTGSSNRAQFDDSADSEERIAIFRGKEWGSYWLVELLEKFGQEGGLNVLAERIAYRTLAPLSVSLIKRLVDSVSRVSVLFSKSFISSFLPIFRCCVFDALLDLSDVEMRDLSKENIDEIVKGMEKLLRRTHNARDSACFVDYFQLRCALKRFRSPLVQRRVNGISFFQDCLSMSGVKRHAYPHWLSPPSLIYWIRSHGMLSEIFGSSGHPELIKRSADLLKFFAQEQRLGRADLDLIWNAMEESMKQKDDDRLQALYGVLDDISLHFDTSLVDYLFARVSSVPFHEYQLATLDLIREMTKYTHRCGPSAVSKAINLLWCVFQDDSTAPVEVALAARHKLEEILKARTLHAAHRLDYLELSVESLKISKAAPHCIALLKQLIDSHPEQPSAYDVQPIPESTEPRAVARSKANSRSAVIQYLDEYYHLLDALFNELFSFKLAAREAAKEFPSPLPSEFNTAIIRSRVSFLSHLKDSFSFLLYLLKNSSLVLTRSHVDRLWSEFFRGALTPEERDTFFRYLRLFAQEESRGSHMFEAGLASVIFQDFLIAQMDYSGVQQDYWTCFEAFFLLVNSAAHRLHLPDTASGRVLVLIFEFSGFECVWRVALQAVSQPVFHRAITFLNELHENLDSSIKSQMAAVRQQYIQHCMALLGETRENENLQQQQRALRCLSLLEQLLDASEQRGVGSLRPHGLQTRGRLLHFTLSQAVSKDKPARIPIIIHANDSLFELRELAGVELGLSAESIKLFANGRTLTTDENSRPLHGLRLRDHQAILVSKRVAVVQQADLVDSSKQVTRMLRAALVEMFEKFARTEGAMSKQDFITFILACGAGEFSVTPERIDGIFKKSGDPATKFEILTCEGFIEFYREASIGRPEAVWADLIVHGFRRDLRKESEVQEEEKRGRDDEKTLPRFLIAANGTFFQQLFDALNSSMGDEVEKVVWRLLQRLPTNPALLASLANLESPDWPALLPGDSPHRLLYGLQILESLTEPLEENDEAGMQRRERWSKDFLASGGFSHLYQLLLKFSSDSSTSLARQCAALLMKLLCAFLVPAMSCQQPRLHSVQRLRSPSLDGLSAEEKAEDEKSLEAERERERYEEQPMLAYMKTRSIVGPRTQDEAKSEEITKVTEGVGDLAIEEPPAGPPTALLLLGRQMSSNFSTTILDSIDFPVLFSAIWRSFLTVAFSEPFDAIAGELVEPALNSLVNLIAFEGATLADSLFEEFRQDATLFGRLALNRNEKVRRLFVLAVAELFKPSLALPGKPLEFFLNCALQALPRSSGLSCEFHCEDYFWLLSHLVHQIHQDSENSGDSINTEKSLVPALFNSCSELLLSFKAPEPQHGAQPDSLLCGLLRMLFELLQIFPGRPSGHSLLIDIFDRLLFSDAPICRSEESRALALQLLLQLGRSDSSDSLTLLARCRAQHALTTKISGWDYSPFKHSLDASRAAYVGLRNLGSTCYIASLLQQFFMIPRLRYGLLQADSSADLDKSESLLYQLQALFSALATSSKQAGDPAAFVHTYKDENGQPINPRIQQDAQEFFNVLCDRIEKRLKGGQFEQLIQYVFGGTLVNQVICHGGCGKDRERDEAFYCVSLQVKSCSSMKESLESYVLGEKLSDFNCDACGKKTEIVKRAVIGKLSNTMIFHLKRFELNWVTFQNEKLNNRFEFPMTIDLEPYTKEGLHRKELEEKKARGEAVEVPAAYSLHPKSHYEYHLVGILVHTGTAAGGHYYSFIKERQAGRDAPPGKEFLAGGRWFEFNDNTVRPFDLKNLEESCFGGNEQSEGDTEKWTRVEYSERIKNAYMLVYERGVADCEAGGGVPADYRDFAAPAIIPTAIKESIEKDNRQFFKDRQILNPAFFNFLSETLTMVKFEADQQYSPVLQPAGESTKLLQWAVEFCLDSLMRSSDSKLFPSFVTILQGKFSENLPACCWMIDYFTARPLLMQEILLTVREPILRKGLVDLLISACRAVAPHERSSYNKEATEASGNFVPRLVLSFLSLFGELPKNWVRFSEYFLFLEQFALLGLSESSFLIGNGVVALLGDLMMGEASPLWDKKGKKAQVGNSITPPDWENAIKTLDVLTQAVKNGATALSERDSLIVYNHAFFKPMISCAQAPESVARLAAFVCENNQRMSESLIETILNGLAGCKLQSDMDEARAHYQAIVSIISLKDSEDLQTIRFESFTVPGRGIIHLLFNGSSRPSLTYLGVKFLLGLMEKLPLFTEFLKSRRSDWVWLDNWLYEFAQKRTAKQNGRLETLNRYSAIIAGLGLEFQQQRPILALPPPSSSSVKLEPPYGSMASNDFSEVEGSSDGRKRRLADSGSMNMEYLDNSTGSVEGRFIGPYSPAMIEAMGAGIRSPMSGVTETEDSDDSENEQIEGSVVRSGNENQTGAENQADGEAMEEGDVAPGEGDSIEGPTQLSLEGHGSKSFDRSDWTCAFCTYINPPHYYSCEMCDQQRKTE